MTQDMRRYVRLVAGAPGTNCPIVEVPGDSPPKMCGASGYHTTPSGKTIVHHPNAYGWPTRYHPSTRRIEVGQEWLKARSSLPLKAVMALENLC